MGSILSNQPVQKKPSGQPYKQGDPRPDPFAADKPLFSITAANVAQYADHLPEGAKALFAKFPDYRMDIYPTRRSASAPQSVYDNVFQNATRARPAPGGIATGVAGAVGGIPFPIPKSGHEVVWNHLLAYWGPAREVRLSTYVVSAAGQVDLTSAYREVADFPYYYAGAAPDIFGRYYFKTPHVQDAPASKFGEGYLAWQPLDIARDLRNFRFRGNNTALPGVFGEIGRGRFEDRSDPFSRAFPPKRRL